MIRYRLFEETRISEGQEYAAYGVAAFNEREELICVTPDITSVKEKAVALAKLCEDVQLSPIHLQSVVEDYIISDNY